jgi:hypothetical protein
VTIAFDEWVASLGGSVSPEATELLRCVFGKHGPVSPQQAARIGREHQLALARAAVGLVGHDIAATTNREAPPFEYRDEGSVVRLAYWGQFATTPLSALTQPEMTVDVADFMQDEIMEDVHGAWPQCQQHGTGVHPSSASHQAVWVCRRVSTLSPESAHLGHALAEGAVGQFALSAG